MCALSEPAVCAGAMKCGKATLKRKHVAAPRSAAGVCSLLFLIPVRENLSSANSLSLPIPFTIN